MGSQDIWDSVESMKACTFRGKVVLPTAIGRMPPFSFVSAVSFAPNIKLRTAAGVLSSRIVSAFKTFTAPYLYNNNIIIMFLKNIAELD